MFDKQLLAFGIALILTFISSEYAMAKEPTVAKIKGPSKEQTISFINNVLKDHIGMAMAGEDDYRERFIKGSVNDCLLKVELQKSGWTGKTLDKFEIDLKDAEKIEYGINGFGIQSIFIRASNRQQLVKHETVYQRIPPEKEQSMKDSARFSSGDEKLAKALEHLRKLCGGPEPLEF